MDGWSSANLKDLEVEVQRYVCPCVDHVCTVCLDLEWSVSRLAVLESERIHARGCHIDSNLGLRSPKFS